MPKIGERFNPYDVPGFLPPLGNATESSSAPIPSEVRDLVADVSAVFMELDHWGDRFNDIVRDLNSLGFWQFGLIDSVTVARQCSGAGHYSITSVADLFKLMAMGPTPHFSEVASKRKHSANKGASHRLKRIALVHQLGTSCDWTCIYCGHKGDEEHGPDNRAWHVDHLFAESRGGDYQQDNLILACATCNLQKNRLLLREFIAKRKTSA